MAGNLTVTSHTKHVHLRYKNVNDCVEDGTVKIAFGKFIENDNDFLTRNLNRELNKKHLNKMIDKKTK